MKLGLIQTQSLHMLPFIVSEAQQSLTPSSHLEKIVEINRTFICRCKYPFLTVVELKSPYYSLCFPSLFSCRYFREVFSPLRISQPRCGACAITEFYLALTLPLFHWATTFLLSLSKVNITFFFTFHFFFCI